MKNKTMMSMLAAAAVSFPVLASAQGIGLFRDVDSAVTFAFRVAKQAEPIERDSGVSNRIVTSRFGPRELIQAVANRGPIGMVAEGGEAPGFPRGSRLMQLDGQVWIVSRQGEPLMNISEYFSIKVAAEPLVAGNFRRGFTNSQSLYLATIGFNVGGKFIMAATAAEGSEGLEPVVQGSVQGIANNRLTSRTRTTRNENSETVSSTTTGRVQGAGRENDAPTLIDGTFRLSGRQVFTAVD